MERITGRFIRKATTVARPIAESPSSVTPFQRKWSRQAWRLGLKMGSSRLVSGSTADFRAPLRNEHDTQARARFSRHPAARYDRYGKSPPAPTAPAGNIHSGSAHARSPFAADAPGLPFGQARALAIRSARSRSSESISAKFTKPSASDRSASLNPRPSSCLSSKACSRCWTPTGKRKRARSSGISISSRTADMGMAAL